MKISELVEHLEKMKKFHGDIQVVVNNNRGLLDDVSVFEVFERQGNEFFYTNTKTKQEDKVLELDH